MDNVKNDEYFLTKIINDLEFIEKHMRNVTYDEFAENEILQDSMMFRLIQVSENARKLTEEYKSKKPDIPWRAISGLRNKIVHEYGGVDYRIVFDTLEKDVSYLLTVLP